MKRALFVLAVLGQGWITGQAMAAGCATGSSFDASCESSSMTFGDVLSAGRSAATTISVTPTTAPSTNAPRELLLIAAPSAATSAQVLNDVVTSAPSTSPEPGASAYVPSATHLGMGISIADISVPELTTALIRPTSATHFTGTSDGGSTILQSTPAPAIVTAIPEPGILLLLGAGLFGVALLRSSRTRTPAGILPRD